MSTESEHGSRPKHRKTHRTPEEEARRKEKKRKREHSSSHEVSSSKKKHKTRGHRESPPQAEPKTPDQLPEDPTSRSPLYIKRASLYLPIAPISQQTPLKALCAEHLSPLLMTFYPPFHAFILSYHNPRLSENPEDLSEGADPDKVYARAIDEYGPTFVWLTADFLLLKPEEGDKMEGYINLQNETTLGLLCWNFFNASIDRSSLPKGWRWVAGGWDPSSRHKKRRAHEGNRDDDVENDDASGDDHTMDELGHYVDQEGKPVKGLMVFDVKRVETPRSTDLEHGFLGIEGTMRGSDYEQKKLVNGAAKGVRSERSAGSRVDVNGNRSTVHKGAKSKRISKS